jgi:hypothetical protein
MWMYKISAYESRAAGESGRVTPIYSCNSGSYVTANHEAGNLAIDYGAAVVENTQTGNRSWHVRTPDGLTREDPASTLVRISC